MPWLSDRGAIDSGAAPVGAVYRTQSWSMSMATATGLYW